MEELGQELDMMNHEPWEYHQMKEENSCTKCNKARGELDHAMEKIDSMSLEIKHLKKQKK